MDTNISAALFADGPPVPGREWLLALHFTPRSREWHGYWSNPGDAGLGMTLDWELPDGWTAGEPRYPVPQRLLIGGLMNHVYEGPYTVIVPMRVPRSAAAANVAPIAVTADYLACTDKICVPQRARLTLDPSRAAHDGRFDLWLAAIVPPLGSAARFELAGERVRIGIPLPAGVTLGDPHIFLETRELGDGLRLDYTAVQTFIREGDLLVAEIPLVRGPPIPGFAFATRPASVSGIFSFGDGSGVEFAAASGDVPLEGVKPIRGQTTPSLAWLLLAALAGGLLLNAMPCVFPILSLKALALAQAGGEARGARRDALAYTAGVVLACAALGAVLLLLRSAGEQVGWAFQLQQPLVVVALLLLSVAITANFLGLFELPGLAIADGRKSGAGSFATGLLAAFVATPCTGPFMAAALGAALLLPPLSAMALFVTLGLGLALPFLLVGFVPAIRRRLPRPGPWMVRFRRWMALPMGLTAAALLWLCWRIGGLEFLLFTTVFALTLLAILAWQGKRQRGGALGWGAPAISLAGLALFVALALPQPRPVGTEASESLLNPQPFSERTLAAARASGKPVFVWFTADWCVSCKVNESVAIERASTREAFVKAGVITLRGDWTLRDPEIARFLTQHGAVGVPLYLWYAPGGEAEQLPQVLTPDLLASRARRAGDSARPTGRAGGWD